MRKRQCPKTLGASADAAGTDQGRGVEATVPLRDPSGPAGTSMAHAGFFAAPLPARADFGVPGLPKDAQTGIDAILALSGAWR